MEDNNITRFMIMEGEDMETYTDDFNIFRPMIKMGFFYSKTPKLTLFRDGIELIYSGNFTYEAMQDFVETHSQPVVTKTKPS